MIKVFYEDLPKDNHGRISWLNSVNYKLDFIFEEIKGVIEILSYNKQNRKLKVKYNDVDYDIQTSSLLKHEITNIILDNKTSEFKVEIGDVFKDNKRDITIIDREYKINKSQRRKYYEYICNKDKYIDYIDEYHLLSGQGCSCCNGNKTVIKGINDIATTHPQLSKYFVNIEDAYKYSYGSGKKVLLKCLDCGTEKEMKISNLNNKGFCCSKCSDKISYPNKAMFNILEQSDIDFETEYNPDWIKPRRYDFYISSINKIIEMDGAFHSNDNSRNNQTAEESKLIDDYKDEQAKLHGIEVIRVDCDYKDRDRLEYIKIKIVQNNKLNELFDFSKIDWNKVEEFACSNLVKIACKYKKDNPKLITSEIGKLMGGYSKSTVISWLKTGNSLNWCDYNPKLESEKLQKSIICIENGIIFNSINECARKSLEIFGVKLLNSNISMVCNGKRKSTKGYSFKFLKPTNSK